MVMRAMGLVIFSLLVAGGAFAQPAQAPAAYRLLCLYRPADCLPKGEFVPAVEVTDKRRKQMETVNTLINQGVKEITDNDRLAIEDAWIEPDGSGDCEDFAIAKRDILLMLGWPSSALLLTIVRNPKNEGHAVLTVVTTKGDLILDEPGPLILPPEKTGHTFFTRQSQRDPKVWEAVPYAR